ncbi:XdhC family protein [Paenibacillus sp. FSL H7-0331]|uniref:XdhC family protein n=1 Tax=Paenibacillus sp. FSL H7-0331 TaxID=1920421 RepID=UPI00096CA64B|nr:XdhC family protein [Paenibacillus sp. FSL H7-0331]OMF18246.1 hypothetical protein BK127_10710 [Paenibacillus sp. FSL H7-0331]
MEFHELLDNWSRREGRAVLTTIIAVEGHSYRKMGASMLIYENGERIGGISPGCLESDLAERVGEMLVTGSSQVVEYDMRDAEDFAWGEAVGCGGSIRVLLETITESLSVHLSELLKRLNYGEESCFMRLWDSDGRFVYRIEKVHKSEAHITEKGQASLFPHVNDDGGSFLLYCEPRPRLILFGAGADAEPIAAMAGSVGFRVVVTDWREALCCSGDFACCDTIVGLPAEVIGRLGVNGSDYVVIMSHQLQRDRQCLDALWLLSPRYVGLLGSTKRAKQLLDGRMSPAWLHWPVGLSIGADGSMEIAVSIVAELIAVRRQSAGGSVRRGIHASNNHGNLFGSG